MNTRLRCILLDDEIPGLTYLKMLCEQFPQLEVVKAFNSPERFLSESKDLKFELCILDIQMPGLNGLQVARLLAGKLIIFTTAYKEYGADAFDLDAVDYVQKPIQKDRLHQAIQKAIARYNAKGQEREFVQLNTDKGKVLIYFDKLGFITTSETDSRDKIVFFIDGTSLILKNISFENLTKVLPSSQFCRINKKEMVSIKVVFAHTYNEITTSLTDAVGQPLNLSLTETYRQDFLKFANQHL